MLTGPFIISVIVGIVVILPTLWLRKNVKSKALKFIPGIASSLAAIYLFYMGYVVIRGFEGGSYMVLAVLLFMVSLIAFTLVVLYAKGNNATEN